jgi:hypothetical protein
MAGRLALIRAHGASQAGSGPTASATSPASRPGRRSSRPPSTIARKTMGCAGPTALARRRATAATPSRPGQRRAQGPGPLPHYVPYERPPRAACARGTCVGPHCERAPPESSPRTSGHASLALAARREHGHLQVERVSCMFRGRATTGAPDRIRGARAGLSWSAASASPRRCARSLPRAGSHRRDELTIGPEFQVPWRDAAQAAEARADDARRRRLSDRLG